MTFKEELVGFCTLAAMGLLGMALYSGTYSMIYASIGVSVPTVAILEMWMTSVHLFVAVGCCVLQGLYAGILKKRDAGIPHLADAQTALFLGVSCAVTILGNECVQYGDCAAYYGAASFPRMAAAGSIAWSWVMYLSSLGCQSWERGLTLGFNGKEALTAASVMVMLPIVVMAKLNRTCQWSSGSVDSVSSMLLMFAGMLVCHLGGSGKTLGVFLIRLAGYAMFMGTFFFLPGAWGAYHFTAVGLACNTLLAELWKGKASATSLPYAAPSSSGGFSLSGLKHKLKATFGHHTAATKKKNKV